MTEHDHREYIEGCFRCDLSREEAGGGVCWVNEDCIAGYHMDEIECRFPSWTDDAAWTGYEPLMERATADSAYRDGLLAAARICRAQGLDGSICPSDMAAVHIERVANGEQP